MTSRNVTAILFASLIAAMVLPFSTMDVAEAEQGVDLIKKTTDPKKFVGDYKTKAKNVGSYLIVTHTFSSQELKHLGVDHVYREEIIPITKDMKTIGVEKFTKEPSVKKSHEMTLVHGDDVSTFDKIRNDGNEFSTHSYQEWKIVNTKASENPKKIGYRQISHVGDWASTKSGSAYLAYDPINIIWSDTQPNGGSLLSKVDSKMSSSGWDDTCPVATDLYMNINGVWKKQTKHYFDNTGGPCNQDHVRAWQVNHNSVIGSAHEEVAKYKPWWVQLDIKHISQSGPNYTETNVGTYGGFYHSLKGFDSAEDEAASEFTGGCWNMVKDAHYMGNQYTRQYLLDGIVDDSAHNDGYATVINCS